MKTSCSSWSYHRTIKAGKLDQLSWLRECAACEFDGVELLGYHFPRTDRDYLITLKRTCAELYLDIPMVSAGGHLTVADDARRAADVKEIGQWAEIAEFLGAPCVRFFCGSGDELAAGGPALYAKVLAAMKQVAALGAARGVVMALENHGGTTAAQILSLHRDVDSPWLRLTLDTGNFPPASKFTPDKFDHIAACAPLAAIVHAKFFNVRPDGADADFDWSRIRGLLDNAGFRGYLSLEYEGSDADELAVCRRVARFMKTLR
jgi:sugar phosphate isomerase/epimerase